MQTVPRLTALATWRVWLLLALLNLAGCATLQQPASEGFVQVPGGKIWYRVAGGGPGVPVILIHGGPGASSEYLKALEKLGDERPVIRYDQLGGGKSDRPDDTQLWRLPRFVAEIEALRRELRLPKYVLLGHSWGATIAVEAALAKPGQLAGLVLASPLVSTRRWLADAEHLRSTLPRRVRDTLSRHERQGTMDDPAYQKALQEYYEEFLMRGSWPAELRNSFANLNRDVYETLWGSNEFVASGILLAHDRSKSLGKIRVPALLTVGRFDEVRIETATAFRKAMPCAELAVFEDSSHMAMLEERDAYLAAVRAFLRRIDAGESCRVAAPAKRKKR